jgi:hypothetical protein
MNPNDPNASPEGGPPPGPPWINPSIQGLMQWRDGDIVVSVPIKSGTNWTMNIVHQLRSGGDADFEDIYVEVPWPEFVDHPQSKPEDIAARMDAISSEERRRAFKSHAAPPDLPYHAPGSGTDVKYIVVLRNPEEAMVSAFPFLGKHTDEWFQLWGIPKGEMVPPDFASFWGGMGSHGLGPMLFGFMAAWWPHRHEKNVLMMHFSDMKKDHEGSIRKIADFLGYEPTAEQWPKILEYTSFKWMKEHQSKFEAQTVSKVPVLESGAMIRKGKTGAQKEDGMTEEIAGQIAAIGRDILKDGKAFEWLYSGGPLPT